MSCKECGSFSINQHLYDRELGVDADLCDVHYWMKRAAKPGVSGAMSREAFERWCIEQPTCYNKSGLWQAWQAATFAQEARVRELEEKYHELLYQVGNKHEGETRHETALRYLRKAENHQDNRSQQALSATAREDV